MPMAKCTVLRVQSGKAYYLHIMHVNNMHPCEQKQTENPKTNLKILKKISLHL